MATNKVEITLVGKDAGLQAALDRARDGLTAAERAARQTRDEFGRFVAAGRKAGESIETAAHRSERAFAGLEAAARRVHSGIARSATAASGVISHALSTAYGVVIGNTVSKAFSSLESAAESFGEKVVSATVEATDAQLFLRNAVKETHGNFAQATADAEALAKAIGLTTSEAKRLQATAQLGLTGTGVDPTKFLARAADLLASRGRPIAELQETIQQLFAGSDEGIGRLLGGGENPSTLWEQYARSVGKSAGALTDLEKKLAVVSVVMQKGALNTGAATQRLDTLGGKLGALQALITDVAAKVGDALQRNVGIAKLIEGASAALGKLSTDQGAVDRLLTKIGEGFVFAANKALDFGKLAARGVNGTVGAFQKMGIAVKQTILDLEITVQGFWQAFQFQAASAIQAPLQALSIFAVAAAKLIPEVILPVVTKAREAADVAAAGGLPGAAAARDLLGASERSLSRASGLPENIQKIFDGANQSIADWITRIEKANAGTEVLEKQLAELGKGYVAVDNATAAANKTTDAFFDSQRGKLDDFAKFNAPAAGPSTITTKLIEEGDSLTGFPVAVAANAQAARDTTAAVNSMTASTNAIAGDVKDLVGAVPALDASMKDLTKTINKGAILEVLAGSGLTVEQVTAGRGTR